MFKMSMDPDVILAIVKFIPKIVWHNDIQTTPLEKLYDTALECIDNSSGSPVVAPKFRDKAYLSAKALVHLGIQRKCMGNGSDTHAFTSISRQHITIGSRHYEEDSDLEYTLAWWIASLGPATPRRCAGANSPSLTPTMLGWLVFFSTVHSTPWRMAIYPMTSANSYATLFDRTLFPLHRSCRIVCSLLVWSSGSPCTLSKDQYGVDKRSVDFMRDFS